MESPRYGFAPLFLWGQRGCGRNSGTTGVDPAQLAGNVAGILPARFWIFREAALHDVIESRRNHRLGFCDRVRIFLQNRGRNRNLTLALKGAAARDHFIEQAAEAEDVAARVCPRALEQLRRHELEGAYDYAVLRKRSWRAAERGHIHGGSGGR